MIAMGWGLFCSQDAKFAALANKGVPHALKPAGRGSLEAANYDYTDEHVANRFRALTG